MNKANVSILAGLAALALLATGCEKLKSRDQLNKGVQAFKNAQVPEAVEHFKKAVELDPDFRDRPLVSGHGLHEPVHSRRGIAGEQQNAKAAEQEFLKVLEQDPKNKVAIALSRR